MDREITAGEYLYNFLYALFKRKYITFAIFFVTFVGMIFGTYLVTSIWKGTTKVRVQYNPKQQLTMFEGITSPGSAVPNINPANDVIQLLMSRDLAEDLALKFERDKLWEKRTLAPESNKEIIRWYIHEYLVGKPVKLLKSLGILKNDPDNYLAMAVSEIQEDLEDVELEEDTTVINVTVWGETPAIATEMSNYLAKIAIEKNLNSSKKAVNEMLTSTREQLVIAEKSLKDAQAGLRKFKEKSGLVVYSEEASILLHRMDAYESELKNMEAQMVALRIDRRVDHPDVRTLEAKINDYKKVILPRLKGELKALPMKEVDSEKLIWDLKVRQDIYTMLKEKILELEALKNSSTAELELTIIDPAKVYSYVKPDWPMWVVNLPLALLGSIFLSIGFVLFSEYWDSSFKSIKELEEDERLHVLGSIPMIGFFKRSSIFRALLSENPDKSGKGRSSSGGGSGGAPFSAYGHLADAILLKNSKPSGNMFLITSPGLGEGKSATSAVLGHMLSKRGKRVLIIEANMRTPSLDRIFGVKAESGLQDYYDGSCDPKSAITSVSGVDVIFSGSSSSGMVEPFEMIASETTKNLMNYARKNYDIVLIDSPCIKRFKEPLVLASYSDGVILVIEANNTPRRSVLMAIEKINGAGGNLKGVVLNKQANYVPEVLQSFLS